MNLDEADRWARRYFWQLPVTDGTHLRVCVRINEFPTHEAGVMTLANPEIVIEQIYGDHSRAYRLQVDGDAHRTFTDTELRELVYTAWQRLRSQRW